MFEEQYQKAAKSAHPSEELQQETLALMQEARAHGIQKEAPPKNPLRYLPAVVSSAAALFIGCVLLGFFLTRGDKIMEDEWGTDSIFEETAPADQDNMTDSSASADDALLDPDTPEINDEEQMKGEGTVQEDSAASGQPADDGSAYPSLSAFLQAITARRTEGYGINYYNAPSLLIFPSSLPKTATFRSLQFNPESGSYSYCFFVTYQEQQYLLEVSIDTPAPQSLSALNKKLDALKEEVVSLSKEANIRIYSFGEDIAKVSLAPLSGNLLPEEAVADAILGEFNLARFQQYNLLLEN